MKAPSRIFVKFLLASLLVVASHVIFAQSQDSITHHYDSLAKIKLSQLDSSNNKINNRVDSIQQRLDNILNPDLNKLTSRFRKKKLEVNDTIRAAHELDSMKIGLNHKIDSLSQLNLPTEKYTRKLDSLNNISPRQYIDKANAKLNTANSKISSVKDKINKPITNVEDKINKPITNVEDKINKPLDLMRQEGGAGANIPGNLDNKLSLDKAGVPGLPNSDLNIDKSLDINNPLDKASIDKPSIDKPSLDNPLGEIQKPSINNPLDNVKSLDEIKDVQQNLGEVNQVTDKVQSYSGDVKNLAQGNIGDTKNIESAVEKKVENLDEMKELGKQTGQIKEAEGMIGKAKDADGMKDMAKQEIQKKAIDHFKGKEEVLKAAMDKMSKIKEKYPSATSIKDLAKRPPNPMKGKPLVERILPGVTLQIMNSHHFMIDINPVVSYRFTGRINAGLGWNERFSFVKWNHLSSYDRVYGPRVFGSFAFKKGFSAKAEIEKMNALIPNSPSSTDGSRQWLWSAFVGIKKDYKFIGRVRGNAQVLYNLYDDHDNSPYFDRLVVRMGFEFPMKKPKKPQNQAKK